MSIDYSQVKSITVFAADVPARWRPPSHKTNDHFYYWREDLVKGLFVGDVIVWESETGGFHQGVIFGEMDSLIKVLYENWGAYVQIESLRFVNGRGVEDR